MDANKESHFDRMNAYHTMDKLQLTINTLYYLRGFLGSNKKVHYELSRCIESLEEIENNKQEIEKL